MIEDIEEVFDEVRDSTSNTLSPVLDGVVNLCNSGVNFTCQYPKTFSTIRNIIKNLFYVLNHITHQVHGLISNHINFTQYHSGNPLDWFLSCVSKPRDPV